MACDTSNGYAYACVNVPGPDRLLALGPRMMSTNRGAGAPGKAMAHGAREEPAGKSVEASINQGRADIPRASSELGGLGKGRDDVGVSGGCVVVPAVLVVLALLVSTAAVAATAAGVVEKGNDAVAFSCVSCFSCFSSFSCGWWCASPGATAFIVAQIPVMVPARPTCEPSGARANDPVCDRARGCCGRQ